MNLQTLSHQLELRERARADLIAKQQVQTLLGNLTVAAALKRMLDVEMRTIQRMRQQQATLLQRE